MHMGLQLWPCHPSEHGNAFDTTLAVAQAAEEAGLDSVWMYDHVMFLDNENPEVGVPILDCFQVLAAIAARTSRIRLGELVVGVPLRNPAQLAKMCATLDVISHGRSIVGLGAAWHEPEFRAYGWSFPSVRERMEMLEEATQIVDLMLTQRPATFAGEHYSITEAYNDPMAVQQPRPPIMIGGGGEKVTLRLVAQYADICNVFGDPEQVAHKFDVLRRHCETVGRPYEEVTRSNHFPLLLAEDQAALALKREKHPDFTGVVGTPDDVLEQIQAYAAVGSQYVTFHLADADDIGAIRLLGETVLPEVARL